jgi:aminoglycoside phosphotransferase (APT) family kinase protein
MTAALQPVPEAFAQALRELGLADAAPLFGEPLAGGVSSDIWRIDTPRGPLCAKRALPKLRVAADWHAPIVRNVFEARWMRVAASAQPGCTPAVLGQHEGLGVLVMDYLSPRNHRLWKTMLRDGEVDVATAQAVARTLARIHVYAAARPALARDFATDSIFYDIRLEPYLVATAARHPDLAAALHALVAQTRGHRLTLVHGDVSPKNILIGPRGPVLLDAECAWWGDPAFDAAFCLNHLLLKCLWNPDAAPGLLSAFEAFATAYLAGVDWEPADALEARIARLLPGLLLARVDGKSPVEYLSGDAQRDPVRRVARSGLTRPPSRLAQVQAAWREECKA